MKIRNTLVAALAVVSSALFAQDSVTNSGLSRYTTMNVYRKEDFNFTNAYVYFTNDYVNFTTTNVYRKEDFIFTNHTVFGIPSPVSFDGVVKQLREQGDMTNLVKILVKSGEVCAVFGHKWASSYVTIEHPLDGNYAMHRACSLCGKVETKEPGVWK
jgi:hypothetical protein